MRFNDQGYLRQWQAGRWPAIHDELFGLIMAETSSTSFCDLGCCFGLLGERVRRNLPGSQVCGIEADNKSVMAAWQAGITFPVLQLKIDAANMSRAIEWMQLHQVSALIARRVLPELWGHDESAGRMFAEHLHRIGVRELFLQGRAESTKTVNPLGSIKHELALVAWRYRPVRLQGQCAYLKAI